MNNTVEKWLFGFPTVKRLQYTSEVGKCTSCWRQIFSVFKVPKIISIGWFLTELYEKIKRWMFFGYKSDKRKPLYLPSVQVLTDFQNSFSGIRSNKFLSSKIHLNRVATLHLCYQNLFDFARNAYVRFFRERELTFTFAICCHPSVCRLFVVCRL